MFNWFSTLPDYASLFFFFNDTATTEIYTLSLHDALPICTSFGSWIARERLCRRSEWPHRSDERSSRSEEHTSELQSRQYLVCRLLLEKKKTTTTTVIDQRKKTTSSRA